MRELSERDVPTLPHALIPRQEELCDRFEAACRSGQQPEIEAYLGEVPESGRPALLHELLVLELAYRRRGGEQPRPEEYAQRFTASVGLIHALCDEENRYQADPAAGSNGPCPDTAEVDGGRAGGSGQGQVPKTIGKYVVLDRIDGGGQGSVYRVLHPHLHGEFLIKFAHHSIDPDSPQRRSLISEGRTLVQLDHPGLARVIDLDFEGDRPFLVLEYVRGRTLDRYADDEHLTPKRAAGLVAELARTVAYLHAQGVVHQDIKPRNIVVDGTGRSHLIDFGLARLRQAWSDDWDLPTGGTPQFMAPEQARGQSERIGPACDVFALGGVVYFLLTGQTPFHGRTWDEHLARAARCEFDRSALSERSGSRRLSRIVLRAMAAEPADRYPDAEGLARDLERYAGRHRGLRRAAISAVILLAILLAALAWPRDGAQVAVPLRIETMEIRHYRDDPSQGTLLLGTVGNDSSACWFDDIVRIRAKLSAPAYMYLVALHPNGQTQLYYPENESKQPRRSGELTYPPGGEDYSPLTDGTGQQVFVLVVSEQPLPPFREWLDRMGELPWRPTPADSGGVWHYDGHSFERLGPEERSHPRKPATSVPAAFAETCRELASRPGVHSIQAWAFPVRAKAEPEESPSLPKKP